MPRITQWLRRRRPTPAPAPEPAPSVNPAVDQTVLPTVLAQLDFATGQRLVNELADVHLEHFLLRQMVAILAKRQGGTLRVPMADALALDYWDLERHSDPDTGDCLLVLREGPLQ